MSDQADAIWEMLTTTVGRRFTDEHGEEPPALWRHELNQLTKAEVSRAFETMKRERLRFPPTLYEFIGMTQPDVKTLGDYELCVLAHEVGVASHGKTREHLERDVAIGLERQVDSRRALEHAS